MIGNVYSSLWADFLQEAAYRPVLFHAVRCATHRINILAHSNPSNTAKFESNPDAYLGYDARDKADYNTEGYDDSEALTTRNTNHAADIALNEELIMMWLLLLSQIFAQPLPHVKLNIETYRGILSRDKNTNTSSGSSSDRDAEFKATHINILEEFAQAVTQLLGIARTLHEEAYLYAIKVVAEVNFQLPLPEDNSCEVGWPAV